MTVPDLDDVRVCRGCGVLFLHIHTSPACGRQHDCNGDLVARAESIMKCDYCKPAPSRMDLCSRCEQES